MPHPLVFGDIQSLINMMFSGISSSLHAYSIILGCLQNAVDDMDIKNKQNKTFFYCSYFDLYNTKHLVL